MSDLAEREPATYLKVPCAVCGQPTDLPAVWECACGMYTLCYRSPCHMRISASHRDGTCARDTNQEQP